jgi:hypothetical protein
MSVNEEEEKKERNKREKRGGGLRGMREKNEGKRKKEGFARAG